MSSINDLIHTNSQLAARIGVRTERYRVIKILNDLTREFDMDEATVRFLKVALKRISEESSEELLNAGKS